MPFSILKLADQSDKSTLKGVYDVESRLTALKKSFQDCDMDDVFKIASSFELDATENVYFPAPSASSLDLFHSFTQVDLETVKHMNSYIMKYGANYMVQNLTWGSEKILNSCDTDLKAKIIESVYKLPIEHRGAIVTFKLMMNHVISTTNSSLRNIINHMNNLRLTHFDGENVSEAVSYFRSARTILRNNNYEPLDIDDIIFTCFKDLSTQEFNSIVTSMASNKLLGVKMVPEGVGDMSVLASIHASSVDHLHAFKLSKSSTLVY